MHNVCLKNKTIVLLPNVCGRGRGGEMEKRPALTTGGKSYIILRFIRQPWAWDHISQTQMKDKAGFLSCWIREERGGVKW